MIYRAEATARYPGGHSIDLGGWTSYSPGRALGGIRTRAEHVAQQLGAPYDGVVHAWLEVAVGYRWAREGLAAGIPFVLRAVDADGCTYALTAYLEAAHGLDGQTARVAASPRAPYVREAA